jgi:hypothetical protein
MTTLSRRAFDQDPQQAIKIAGWSPVFIIDRGRPAGIEDVKVEFPRSREPAQPADFS